MTIEAVPDYFKGFAVDDVKNWNKPKLVEYPRKQINPHDVVVKIIACGLCGSELHTLQGNWGPLKSKNAVVGHEIIGHVISVGDEVTSVKIGQRVGIGAGSAACRDCRRCANNNEQYCKTRVGTYQGVDSRSEGYITQGGYASHSIADEQFVFPIPDKLSSNHAAPMMCAGLTVYSPLVRNLGKDARGKTVGIVGIGGLGHLAIQFAHALGAHVVTFSRSSAKKEEALKMGADDFIATAEEKDWATKYSDTFDFILNCGSGSEFTLNDYLSTLAVDGKFVSVGLPPVGDTFAVSPFAFLRNAGSFGASALGSKIEAIEMLELAAEKGIKPWIEEIQISEEGCHEALTRCENGDVRYRFVFTGFEKAFGN